MGRNKSPTPSSVGNSKKNKSTPHGGGNRSSRKNKKMRKSSLSKVQKNFQVFNDVDNHINKYENLTLDCSDTEKAEKKHHYNGDILIIDEEDNDDGYDDYDGHYDSPRDVPIVEVSSDDASDSNAEYTAQMGNGNSLTANDDFIAFSESSEEEQEDPEKTHQQGQSSRNIETETAKSQTRTLNTDYPWILNHDHSRQKEIADWLTMEIKDFVAYISPNRIEIETRNKTISKVRHAVKQLWPDADLNVFGSYATDLYLPGSDIDCVIISEGGDKENRNSLYSLASHLKRKNLATRVEVIAKARVPIIKFVEPESQIHIDVSFERTNGIEAARLIREWLDETPGLRELVLIVKQFLHSRRLNNVHTGGLGGFSIICLVFAFLHLHPRVVTNEIDPLENLGVLLIDFFELYGKNFGYDDVGISLTDGKPSYIPKCEWRDIQTERSSFTLAIQDPGDSSNNISRGSFNLRDIKKAFAGAFHLLTNRCFELDIATFKERLGKSILGDVIKYRGKPRDFKDERDLVINKAIEENENYHKKRSRIVHNEVFIDPSAEESIDEAIDEEDDIYHLEELPMKKRKKNKQKTKSTEKKIKITDVIAKTRIPKQANFASDQPKKSIDSLMGLPADEDEEDGYNPLELEPEKNPDNDTNEIDNDNKIKTDKSSLKKYTVDAQTRRDYWLGKSNVISSNIP